MRLTLSIATMLFGLVGVVILPDAWYWLGVWVLLMGAWWFVALLEEGDRRRQGSTQDPVDIR